MKSLIKFVLLTLILILTTNLVFAQTPTTAESWFELGNKQFNKKLYSYASKSFSECIKINPRVPNCYYNRALSYYYSKFYSKAITDFSKVIEFNLNTAKAYKLRGDSYRLIGKKELGHKDLNKAIELNAKDPDAFYLRGLSYLWQKKRSLAIADFTRAIELNHPILHLPYLWRATQYCDQGQVSLAKADEKKVIELGGKVYGFCTAKADQKSQIPSKKVNQPQSPTTTDGWFKLGKSQLDQKKYADAVTSFTKCIELNSKAEGCFDNRGITYLQTQKYQLAINDFTKVISIVPKYSSAYNNRGVAHYYLKNIEAALADITKSLQFNPKNANGYFVRSIIYCEQGKKQLAKTDEQKATELGLKITKPCI